MVRQRSRKIRFQGGFLGSFEATWSERSWINLSRKETQNPFSDSFGFKNPILDFLKQTHPKTRSLAIDMTNEPTKTLGIYISYNRNKNNDQNFFIKIQKMETKLNVLLSRDLTLMGRTLLVKALGISKIVYSASMLCVPEEVIKRVQVKLFSYLWRNKKKRQNKKNCTVSKSGTEN